MALSSILNSIYIFCVLLTFTVYITNAQISPEPEIDVTTTTEAELSNATSCWSPPLHPDQSNSTFLCIQESRRPDCNSCTHYYVCRNDIYVSFMCDLNNHFSDTHLVCMTINNARCFRTPTTRNPSNTTPTTTTSGLPITTTSTMRPPITVPTLRTTPRPTTRTTPRRPRLSTPSVLN